jgi:hypothetical protein
MHGGLGDSDSDGLPASIVLYQSVSTTRARARAAQLHALMHSAYFPDSCRPPLRAGKLGRQGGLPRISFLHDAIADRSCRARDGV